MTSGSSGLENIRQRSDLVAGVLLALIALAYVVHAWATNFISDDTFITLRYARNLAEGHGLVFNPGERVEGYTSFLWTVLLAGLNKCGLDLLVAARWGGLALGLIALLAAHRLALLCLPRNAHPWLALVAPLVMAANGSYVCWAFSGMETMLYVALVVGACLATFTGRLGWSSALSAALILTRPEGVFVVFGLGVCLLFRHAELGWKRVAGWTGIWVAALAALLVFRLIYHGDVVPNTYHAKSGGGLTFLARGFRYFLDYAAAHDSVPVLVIAFVVALARGGLAMRFTALIGGGLWLSTIAVGGDGLPMFRFALAQLPLVAVAIVFASAELGNVALAKGARRGFLAILGLPLAALLVWAHATPPTRGPYHLLMWHQRDVEVPAWSAAGKWLGANADPGASIAAVPIGAVAYYSRLTAIDMLGLTDAHIAKREMPNMGQGWAGHEKHDGQYVLSRRPTYILAGNITITSKPRDPATRPFFTYTNPGVWEREGDLYETDLIARLYEPKCFQIAPAMYLSVFALKSEHRP